MKKFISIVLLLVMVLSLCACGKTEEAPAEPSPSPEVSAEPVETAPAGPEPAVVAAELYFAGDYDGAYDILADIEGGSAVILKALCLYYGYGTEIDAGAAAELLEPLAAEGNAVANHLLGKASLVGNGVVQNPEKAKEYFKAAIAASDMTPSDYELSGSVYFALADCYANALGVDADADKLLSAARTAADKGTLSPLERFELAALVEKSADSRREKAEEKISDLGLTLEGMKQIISNPAGYSEVTVTIYKNILAGLDTADEEMALACELADSACDAVRALADEDNIYAVKLMGDYYFAGLGSEGQDYEKAMDYYMQAADFDYAPAQAQLALMYQDGLGVEVSYEQAMEWNNRAAQQGNAQGQAQIGYMYHMGLGVTQNLDEAGRWYSRAAELGNTWAAEKFQETEITNPHAAFEFHA